MNLDRTNLKNDTADFLVGAEKHEALSALEKLDMDSEHMNRALAALQAEENQLKFKRRIVAMFFSLPFAGVFLYMVVAGILTGKTSFTMQRHVEFIYWSDDPYLFSFAISFLALIGLVLLYLALVPIITGREATGLFKSSTRRSSGVPQKRGSP